MVTEHTLLTKVTDTDPPSMPLFACRFHPLIFPSVPFGFPRGLFPRRCHSVLVFSADHLEDGRDGDLIGLAVPEECRRFPFTCCQDDAYRRAGCRKRGGPSSPERLSKCTCLHPCGPTASAMRRTALRNEELVRSKRVAPALLSRSSGATACTAQQCRDAPAQAQVRTSRLLLALQNRFLGALAHGAADHQQGTREKK